MKLMSIVSALTCAFIATTAMASDRVILTHDLLGEVSKVNDGIEKLRVYVSSKTEVEYVAKGKSSTDVDKDVHRKKSDDYLTEKLGRKTRGKIIDIDYLNGTVANRLYVTFDQAICNKKECAWIFVESTAGRTKKPKSNAGKRFSLTAAPVRDGFSEGIVTTDGDEMSKSHVGVLLDEGKDIYNGKTISLVVKLDEVHDITRTKKRHKGVD